MNDAQITPREAFEEDDGSQDQALSSEDAVEVAALRAELDARAGRERAALEQFRAALLLTQPEMDPALVTGDSFETIHASFGAARASLARVREALRLEAAGQIPMGAPGRTRERYRSPLQKIRDGLSEA